MSFSVKAVHIEAVMDLSVEAFVACLRRFIASRGKPADLYSDNGTNFMGANNELKALYDCLQERDNRRNVLDLCTTAGIKWHFSPERAPHFGGLWESTIKSVKTLLRKTIGEAKLSYEEMSTVFCQIESCLNSRPLVPVNSHSDDGIDILTPGHFLIGKSLEALPDITDVQPQQVPLQRWNLCQRISREFWERWSREYLCAPNRYKRTQPSRNIRPKDVVLVKDQQLFGHTWPLGRVQEVFTGSDGKVWVVQVKTSKGTYKRTVSKLVLLLPDEDEDVPSSPGEGWSSQLDECMCEVHPS